MKKLLLGLLVLTSIYSCGKNNSVSPGGTTQLSSALQSSAYAVNVNNAINNNTFAAINSPFLYFYYGSGSMANTNNSSSQNCGTWLGFIPYCTYSSNNFNYNSVSYSNGVAKEISGIDLQTKKNELMAIVNSAPDARYISQGQMGEYYIYTSTKVYVIDTKIPLQANPAQVQDVATGITTTWYKYIPSQYPITPAQLDANK